MVKKKEKTTDELVMSFMTKIKNVFKKDIYIKDGLYIFGGNYSDEDIFGDVMCILEPEFVIAISKFFNNTSKLIYIDNVADFKKEPSYHILYEDENESLYTSLEDIKKRISLRFNSCKNWKSMSEQSDYVLNKLFKENSFVNMKDREDVPFITIGKKLFPLLTPKNLEDMMYSIDNYNDGLYTMSSKFQFTHFQVQSVYYFLDVNELD